MILSTMNHIFLLLNHLIGIYSLLKAFLDPALSWWDGHFLSDAFNGLFILIHLDRTRKTVDNPSLRVLFCNPTSSQTYLLSTNQLQNLYHTFLVQHSLNFKSCARIDRQEEASFTHKDDLSEALNDRTVLKLRLTDSKLSFIIVFLAAWQLYTHRWATLRIWSQGLILDASSHGHDQNCDVREFSNFVLVLQRQNAKYLLISITPALQSYKDWYKLQRHPYQTSYQLVP